jgi:hypothetical protein
VSQCRPDITDFPLHLTGQREHYRSVWSRVPVDADINARPVDLNGVGGSRSEWVWTEVPTRGGFSFYFHGGGYVMRHPHACRNRVVLEVMLTHREGVHGEGSAL